MRYGGFLAAETADATDAHFRARSFITADLHGRRDEFEVLEAADVAHRQFLTREGGDRDGNVLNVFGAPLGRDDDLLEDFLRTDKA